MLEIKNLNKKFNNHYALKNINISFEKGKIYGIIGTNGSGKTTLFNIISGIFKPDIGEILIDNIPIFNNKISKSSIIYIHDNCFYFKYYTPIEMAKYYGDLYKNFDLNFFYEICKSLDINPKKQISTLSKGQKNQVFIAIALSLKTDFILMDEILDGIDIIKLDIIKKILINEMDKRIFTPIICTHTFDNLYDITDNLILINNGNIIFNESIYNLSNNIFKINIICKDLNIDNLKKDFNIIKTTKEGSLISLIVNDDKDKVLHILNKYNPMFLEDLSLNFRELFNLKIEEFNAKI